MRLSIIVPVYNVESYLSECIESVLNQIYPNYEMILIDDGSTDESGNICDEYSALYPNTIKAFHISNAGPLYARLYGMEVSQGDALVFLDSDDTLRNDALQKIADSFTEDCDMVLYNAELTEAFSSKEIKYSYASGQKFEKNTKQILCSDILMGRIPNSVCTKAIRKQSAVLPEHLSRLGRVKYGEDLILSAYFITNCRKIAYIQEGLYHYRVRQGSAVHSFDMQRKDSIKIVHTELGKCVEQWGIPALKPLHDFRKVKGWVDTLWTLLNNAHSLGKSEFHSQMVSMAEDPYFTNAYENMDASQLSRRYRMLASLLYKKKYIVLRILSKVLQMRRKLKSGR